MGLGDGGDGEILNGDMETDIADRNDGMVEGCYRADRCGQCRGIYI